MNHAAVRAAIRDINDLTSIIESDLGDSGGFSWWVSYPLDSDSEKNRRAREDLSDYLIEVAATVAVNLESAEIFLTHYREKKYSVDYSRRAKYRAGEKFFLGEEAELKKLRAYSTAFIGSVSSALDTFAGVLVGVGGLSTSLVKADIRLFQPFAAGEAYIQALAKKKMFADPGPGRDEQEALVRTLRTAILQSGPPGWEVWADQLRNAALHRGRHLQVVVATVSKDREPIFPTLPVAEPSLTTLQNLRIPGKGITDVYILEDLAELMSEILNAVAATVCGTVPQIVRLWQRRRDTPRLINQPRKQVHVPGAPLGFKGFAPNPALAEGVAGIVVDPQTARRLSSGGAVSAEPA